MKKNHYFIDKIESMKLVGASILCFSVDPQYGGIYFLLGKEKKTYKYHGSEKWSDFGGSTKAEEIAEECAAREFHEETCAIVKFFADEKLPRKHYNIVMRELKKEKYYMRVEFEHDNHKKYVTFVKQIPWNASYPTIFSESINTLIKYTKGTAKIPVSEEHPAVTNLEEEEIKINRDYMEKQAIQYWSMPQLKSAIAATRHVLGHRCNRPEMLRESFVSRLASIMEKFPIDMCNELRMCGHFDKYLLHTPLQKNASVIFGRHSAKEGKKSNLTSNSFTE